MLQTSSQPRTYHRTYEIKPGYELTFTITNSSQQASVSDQDPPNTLQIFNNVSKSWEQVPTVRNGQHFPLGQYRLINNDPLRPFSATFVLGHKGELITFTNQKQ